MAIPRTIPIAREEGYHTDRIGTFAGGQFMGFVTATLPMPPPDDWPAKKRWYAVLHTFDTTGQHTRTEAVFAGTTADGERDVVDRAQRKLDGLIEPLDSVHYGDISVGLFEVEIDGERFGLVDMSDRNDDYERVDLLPNDLAFFEPWDGSYDT
ncbi:MAG: hypothetical protein ACRBN8_46155 [Nannocystales bacterium]